MGARWLVLVNPAAGRSPVTPDSVREALDAAGVEYEIALPASRIETERALAEGAASGREHFAVVGGDGTVNLAVNTLLLLGLPRPPTIGVLPSGTGCDLLRTFALPQDLGGAARHLATEDVYDVDVVALEGEWGLRYFANVAQVGVGAAAVATANKMNRGLGAARYPLAFAARLPRFHYAGVTVTTERRSYHQEEVAAVIVANAQFFAGGWNVAPRATLNDGAVDIQVLTTKKMNAPALVPKIIKGTHLGDPTVRRFSAVEFKIEVDRNWPLEADGDIVGNTPVTGRVVPAAVRLKI